LLTPEIIGFSAQDTGEMRKQYLGGWIGLVRPKLAWQTTQLSGGVIPVTRESDEN